MRPPAGNGGGGSTPPIVVDFEANLGPLVSALNQQLAPLLNDLAGGGLGDGQLKRYSQLSDALRVTGGLLRTNRMLQRGLTDEADKAYRLAKQAAELSKKNAAAEREAQKLRKEKSMFQLGRRQKTAEGAQRLELRAEANARKVLNQQAESEARRHERALDGVHRRNLAQGDKAHQQGLRRELHDQKVKNREIESEARRHERVLDGITRRSLRTASADKTLAAKIENMRRLADARVARILGAPYGSGGGGGGGRRGGGFFGGGGGSWREFNRKFPRVLGTVLGHGGSLLGVGLGGAGRGIGSLIGVTTRLRSLVGDVGKGFYRWTSAIFMAHRAMYTLQTFASAMIRPFTALFQISNEFEKSTWQLAAAVNAAFTQAENPKLLPETSVVAADRFARAFQASSTAMQLITREAARLPGEAEDYVQALVSGQVGMTRHGINTLGGQVSMASRFSATAQMLGVTGDQAARDLQSFMTSTVTKRSPTMRSLAGFLTTASGKNLSTAKEYNKASAAEQVEAIEHALAHFAETLDKYNNTYDAQMGTLKSNLRMIARLGGQPVYGAFVSTLKKVNAYLEKNQWRFAAMGQEISRQILRGAGSARRGFNAARNWLSPLGAQLTGKQGNLRSMAGDVGRFGGMIAPFGFGALTPLSSFLGVVKRATGDLDGFQKFLGQGVVILRRFGAVGSELGKLAYTIGGDVMGAFMGLVDVITPYVNRWAPRLSKAFADMGAWLDNAVTVMGPPTRKFLGSLFDVGEALGNVFGPIVTRIANYVRDHWEVAMKYATDALWFFYDAIKGTAEVLHAFASAKFWEELIDTPSNWWDGLVQDVATAVSGEDTTFQGYMKAHRGENKSPQQLFDEYVGPARAVIRDTAELDKFPRGRWASLDTSSWQARRQPGVNSPFWDAYRKFQGIADPDKAPWFVKSFWDPRDANRLMVSGTSARDESTLDVARREGNYALYGGYLGSNPLAAREAAQDNLARATREFERYKRSADRDALVLPSSSQVKADQAAERERAAAVEAGQQFWGGLYAYFTGTSNKFYTLEQETDAAGAAGVGAMSRIRNWFSSLFNLTGEGVKASADKDLQAMFGRSGGANNVPKGGGTTYDFRYSHFNVEQKIAEGFDVDRVMTVMSDQIGKLAERRVASQYSSVFGADY